MDEHWMDEFCAALRGEIEQAAKNWKVKPRVIVRDSASLLLCIGKAARTADAKKGMKR